jgi:hypothetical protein
MYELLFRWKLTNRSRGTGKPTRGGARGGGTPRRTGISQADVSSLLGALGGATLDAESGMPPFKGILKSDFLQL